MRKLILGAIVAAALVGCGGSDDDSAGVCGRCSPDVEFCREFCGDDRECAAECRECGGGLYCTPFFSSGFRCAIEDGETCCDGDQSVECD